MLYLLMKIVYLDYSIKGFLPEIFLINPLNLTLQIKTNIYNIFIKFLNTNFIANNNIRVNINADILSTNIFKDFYQEVQGKDKAKHAKG